VLAYFDHREAIEAEMAEELRMVEELRTGQPSILEAGPPGLLRPAQRR
jgi:hypothetical protein